MINGKPFRCELNKRTEEGVFNSPANHKGSGISPRSNEGEFMTGNKAGIQPRAEEGKFNPSAQNGRTGKSRISG